jgi:hypothetical protein
MLDYSVNHARSGSHSCSASLAAWLISLSPLPALPFWPAPGFHDLFAGCKPEVTVAEILQCTEPIFRNRRNWRTATLLRVLSPQAARQPATGLDMSDRGGITAP